MTMVVILEQRHNRPMTTVVILEQQMLPNKGKHCRDLQHISLATLILGVTVILWPSSAITSVRCSYTFFLPPCKESKAFADPILPTGESFNRQSKSNGPHLLTKYAPTMFNLTIEQAMLTLTDRQRSTFQRRSLIRYAMYIRKGN